ncbi:hypothetical protein GGR58DRAFT_493668 [Xylaria digitata]|nr:hypothetical protein GGR58DRAFT_493668 [Xylaria digitata]
MRFIYSSASETVIYLGGETGGNIGLSAWNFLERHATWAMNSNRDADPGRPAEMEALTEFRGELSDVEVDVLQRPWFTRLWVLQEVVVSKTLSIQCGSRRVPWDDFCKILLLTPRYVDRYGFSLEQSGKIEIVRDMFQARCSYQERSGMDHVLPQWRSEVQKSEDKTLGILDLLQRTRFQLEASDARDKIFGLLGISSGIDLEDEDFAVDYSQDDASAYTRFTKNFIRTTGNYDILSYIGHSLVGYDENVGLTATMYGLPSWVPNWNLSKWNDWPWRNTRTILSTLPSGRSEDKPLSCEQFNEHCGWVHGGYTLVASGFMIGQIDCVSNIIEISGLKEIIWQEKRDSELPQEEKNDLILRNWIESFYRLSPILDRKYPFENAFAECLNSERGTNNGTVEYHLLARSRKTDSWANDSLISPNLVIDKSSIVDGKRLAIYSLSRPPHTRALAIVPAHARTGDFLVDLIGGRVPFTIRLQDADPSPDIDFGIRDCILIGESVVNRVIEDMTTCPERVFLIH